LKSNTPSELLHSMVRICPSNSNIIREEGRVKEEVKVLSRLIKDKNTLFPQTSLFSRFSMSGNRV
jgi:hypothetical protein